MLTKEISYDHSITESGHVQVRQITRIMEDGVELSKTYHRHVVTVYDEGIEKEDTRTQQIIAGLKTDVKEEYDAAMEDGVITEEEKESIWNKVKGWFSK